MENKNSEVHLMVVGDDDNKQIIKETSGIAHLISIHYKFSDVKVNKVNTYITYEGKEYEINIKEPKSNIENEVVFRLIIKVKQNNECSDRELEKFVNTIITLLHTYFKKIYITRNDICKNLCNDSYIYIHTAENKLREFIMNFMITKVGNEWWKYNVTDSNINKASSRDEDPFNPFVVEDIYNIDFKDLSEIIFKNQSQYKSKSDVLDSLKDCKTLEDFQQVRKNAISNWEKYFSEYFDVKWSKKWKRLGDLRNKIAHNKLIRYEQYEEIEKLSKELIESIENASKKIDSFNYSSMEICSIEDKLIEVKGFRQEASIKKLKEEGIEVNDINLAIKVVSENTETFTCANIVREIKGEYITNRPINLHIGLLLSTLSSEFSIEPTGKNLSLDDDNGNKTTAREYRIINKN